MRIVRFISLAAALVLILSISAFAAAPVINVQPQNVYVPSSVTYPFAAAFSVIASGENLTYRWQTSYDGGLTWQNTQSEGYNTPSMAASFRSDQINGVKLLRCIVSSDDGSVVSSAVTVTAGAYILHSIPQMLASGTEVINSIFGWVGSACGCIIDTPLLLIGVSFFALGASVAFIGRLLSRS